jgi:hypothetical protein
MLSKSTWFQSEFKMTNSYQLRGGAQKPANALLWCPPTRQIVAFRYYEVESKRCYNQPEMEKRSVLTPLLIPHQYTCQECSASFTAISHVAKFCPACRPKMAAKRVRRHYETRKGRKGSQFAFLSRLVTRGAALVQRRRWPAPPVDGAQEGSI